MCLMRQDENDDFNYILKRGPTPSKKTGPTRAQRGDYYIFIEASKPRRNGEEAM